MAEYIEREALLLRIDCYGTNKFGMLDENIRAFVKEQPAADVAPVVHGEWLLRHEGYGHYWECSSCHKNPCIYVTKDTRYCPNCGAKMDIEDGGADNEAD